MLAAAYLDWLYNALGSVLAFFYALIPSYGFAIILLTISVRVLLIPLTAKQVKSQRAMQVLQPELKKLQAKYKGDRQKLNEEMMKLYKEHKANPLAGCLPLILQMPLFIVLYRIIRSLSVVPPKHIPAGSSLYHALLGSKGTLESFGIDLAHKPQSVLGLFLVAAVVASGYYQQRQMTARMSKDAINPQMQMVTKIMPGFFGLISLSVPAGVVLYFITSNLWQIGQQAVAFRNRTPGEADETSKATGKSGGDDDPAGAGGKPIAKSGGPNPGGSAPKGGGNSPKGGGNPPKVGGGGGSAKGGGPSAKGGGPSAKGGGPGGPAKNVGQSKNVGTPKGGGPKKPAGGSGGGSTRPPSGRVTPKGGGSGRVTPKGGPNAAKSGNGAGSGSGAGAGQKAGKATSKSASASSSGKGSSGPTPAGGESLLSRLSNRAAKAKRPPPAARPKGLPPTKGSSGGSSRKES
ncbi:MAG: YidC/Oxa1 family rane protein insertase [Actinomycetota bacterium]|jgi:YidC/Oxa1 family membrane protein insertase|nr:YidC/Oxa1 family rane protein insertase [Actinomycetota bacterium]